ncbi:MAG TPA: glycine--tRNA ligase subunit beta [Candidatus Binatia bacterium]|nr:glycine--tRNA ligase subunit beta [Candidatus Binatia bacterium]
MADADLLIEIGCEDLPARYVVPLADALKDALVQGLDDAQVPHGSARRFATPRRIAALVSQVAARQPDRTVERKGPKLALALKEGQPTPAGLGFARSCGVDFAQLAQEDGQLVFRSAQAGRGTAELLPDLFERALARMDEVVPRRMRWGSGDETFVRPVRWLLALHGPRVIPLKRFGLKAGAATHGHRFHAPKPIALKTPAQYESRLRAAKVWADADSRRDEIRAQIEAAAKKVRGRARIEAALLDEVTALVEWPVVISGRMEARFLTLPPEVVIATIEHNQRYFPVAGADGGLLPDFIAVSNIQSRDVARVVEGNERVVRPRLTDALFFWEQDRRKPLAGYVADLDRVTFQKDLGSTGDKARRVAALAGDICRALGEPAAEATRAAALCKADLVTRMVFEFPELQGVMGGYYAAASGEPDGVAQAIREHYRPTQAGGPLPESRAGQVVALADKLDTLAGIFAAGQRPTASKDPFALRRAAIGALRLCIECRLPLDLRVLLGAALAAQPAGKRDERTLAELWEFVLERLRGLLGEQGVAVEVVAAVAATGTARPLDFVARVEAVRTFLGMAEAAQLAAAHKRIRNLLKQAGPEGAAAQASDGEVDEQRLRDREERGLFDALRGLDGTLERSQRDADYTGGLRTLARLQGPVDAFFDKVMVMAPEPELRANRLALLRRLDRLCRSVADLSCLPG